MSESTDILKHAHLKNTPIRRLILATFSPGCKPTNAELIHAKLKNKGINQVTIYRTLACFEQVGILKKVDLHKGSAFYELAGRHHHHIVCVTCGRTEGFENCNIDTISKEALKKSSLFKTVDQHSFELFGVCKSCSKS